MRFCFLDTETRARVPIEHGNDLYTRGAQCMIVTYALSGFLDGKWIDQPSKIWEPWQEPAMPFDLRRAIEDQDVIFVAHNAVFDRFILLRCCLNIRIAINRWMCTRAMAYAHGLPGSLEMLGIVLELPQDHQKLIDDSKLIHTFCEPQAATGEYIEPWQAPVEWQRFCNYAVRDTDALREIYKKLPGHNYSGLNLRLWHIDQLINERGFQFDDRLARSAVEFLGHAKRSSDANMAKLSEGQVHAATQRNRLLKYLRERCGIDIESLRASEVREWLEHDDLEPITRLLLEQRLEASKSSGSKYGRGIRMCGPRGRQRNTIQFNGAGRTGRDSGRGFQPHNMARPVLNIMRQDGRIELSPVEAAYIDSVIIPGIYSGSALVNPIVYGGPNEACALALRHVITAAPGNELVVADWKNIESRILAWIANEEWKLEAYRANDRGEGADLYKLLFSQFFGVDINTVNDTERQSGKVSELAFGFGGAVGALVTMAAGYQMDLDPLAQIVLPRATEQQKKKAYQAWRRAFLSGDDFELEPKVFQACHILCQSYRESNAKIDQLKHDLDKAIKAAIKAPNKALFKVGRCKIWSTSSWLIIELPSGRRLLYASPTIHTEVEKDDDITTGKIFVREVITYTTARGKSWRRERAWPGLFLENIVQAIANDVLRGAKERVHLDTLSVPAVATYLDTLPEEERTAISLHVHDEIALDLPRGIYPLKRLVRAMTQPFKRDDNGEVWSDGLPLAAEGWVHPRYGKRKAMKEAA